MPDYECDICKKKFTMKIDFTRHINRKFKCKEDELNVINDDNKYKCILCHKQFIYKSELIRHTNNKKSCMITNNDNLTNDNPKNDMIINVLKCEICNKDFASIKSLNRHKKTYCNQLEKIDKNELIDLVKNLKKEINEKDKLIINNMTNIGNTNNIGNTQNIQNNITINAYGKEDISHITDKDYKQLFTKCNSLIPTLIELIHFNEDKPENTNVYISNIKSPYAYVYDGNKWNLMNKDEIIDDIYDNKCIIIIDKFDDMKDILNKHTIELFNKFIEKHDSDIMKKNISDKIQLLLYNNRNLIKK
jgi:hypothetical protein